MKLEKKLALTEQQMREIIIADRRKKKIRRRRRRKYTFFISLFLVLFFVIGLYRNRDVLAPPKLDRGVIFIDPGHGGHDPGSQTKSRKEKDDTLRIALQIKKELNKKNFKVYLTRENDSFTERIKIGKMANRKKAKLMVSIHRNKAGDPRAQGVEVFLPKDDNPKSRYLGKQIMKQLHDEGFAKRRVRSGTLVSENNEYDELSINKMPSCLVEIGFISNKHDNKLFDKNLKENAKAVADAIEKTYSHYYEKDKKSKKDK